MRSVIPTLAVAFLALAGNQSFAQNPLGEMREREIERRATGGESGGTPTWRAAEAMVGDAYNTQRRSDGDMLTNLALLLAGGFVLWKVLNWRKRE